MFDRGYLEANELSDPLGGWPTATGIPVLPPGQRATRTLVAFNDTFVNDQVDVGWELRVDRPDGPVAASGSVSLDIPRGTSRAIDITFTAPTRGTRLYRVLSSTGAGSSTRFLETDMFFALAGIPAIGRPRLPWNG